MEEIWKYIEGYEGLYQISNLSNARSVDRYVYHYKSGKQLRKGNDLKQGLNTGGYYHVGLSKNGVKKQKMIHRLVAKSFINNPECLEVVNHINGNIKDNAVRNLEWCTQRQNVVRGKSVIGTSKFIGISFAKERKKWVARIRFNGIYKSLGYFINEVDAHTARVNYCLNNNINYK